MTDQWVPGPAPAPPQWVNPLPPSNDWSDASGCAPGGPSIVDGIIITGVPATISSLYWQIVLDDGQGPANYLINHLDGQGDVLDTPMEISGVDASVTFNTPVYLSRDPVEPMEAVTKEYLDAHSGGIPEAPMDNYPYARYMATWERLPQTYIPEAPSGQIFGRFNGVWAPVPIQADAPTAGGLTYGRSNGAWSAALPLTGGAIVGSLSVSAVLTVLGSNSMVLNALTGGQQRAILAQTNGANRWQMIMADQTAEAGSDTGSNFAIWPISDAGSLKPMALGINRATGAATFGGAVNMNAGAAVNGSFALQGPGSFILLGGSPGQMLETDGNGGLSWQTPPGASGGIPDAPSNGAAYTRMNAGWQSGGAFDGTISFNPGGLISVSPLSLQISGGAAGQFLSTNGAGTVSWATPAGGGGGIDEAPTDGTPYARENAAWVAAAVPANYLLLTGGTLTGPLLINGPANTHRMIKGQSAGVDRWQMSLGNSSIEGGSNLGSDFALYPASDAGGLNVAAMTITRADSSATFAGQVTTAGIVGTRTSNNAAAGTVGEVISSNVTTPVMLTLSASAYQIASIPLTAGDWDVCGEVWFITGATAPTAVTGAINTAVATPTTSALNTARGTVGGTLAASATEVVALRPCRVSLAAPATYYLVAQANFSAGSTNTATGNIWARRAR